MIIYDLRERPMLAKDVAVPLLPTRLVALKRAWHLNHRVLDAGLRVVQSMEGSFLVNIG